MSMAVEVMYINICSFATIFIYMLTLVHDFVITKFLKSMHLSNITVIGQPMAEIQLLPVSENKGGPKIKKFHVTPPLDPVYLICILLVRAPCPLLHTKFEVSSCSRSGDVRGPQNSKVVHMTRPLTHLT